MNIRLYRPGDACPIAALFVRSVEQLGPRDYSPQQVEAWASRAPSAERVHARATDGRTTLVAVDDTDRPIAFGDLESDGHIDFLYCAPEAAGTGVTSALYDELERIARERGITRLYSEASEAARRFFLKKSFLVRARRQLELDGVPIHNFAVEKTLTTEQPPEGIGAAS